MNDSLVYCDFCVFSEKTTPWDVWVWEFKGFWFNCWGFYLWRKTGKPKLWVLQKQKGNLASVLKRKLANSFMAYSHIRMLKVRKSLESFLEDKWCKEEFQIWVVYQDTVTYSHSASTCLTNPSGITNRVVLPSPVSCVIYSFIYQPSKILQRIHWSVGSHSKSQCGCHWRAWTKALDQLYCLFYSNCSVWVFFRGIHK